VTSTTQTFETVPLRPHTPAPKRDALEACSLRLVSVLLILTGCAHMPMRGHSRPPLPVPPPLIERYHIPDATIREDQTERHTLPDYRLRCLTLHLDHADNKPLDPIAPNQPIDIELYETRRAGRRPAILVSPILGGSYPIERSFCRFFARQGFHAVLVHREKIDFGSDRGAVYVEEMLARAVITNRVVIQWMATQPAIDPERLGLFGISLGGIVGIMTAAVEPSLNAHVIALTGGSIADIFRTTSDPTLTIPRNRYLERTASTTEQLCASLQDTVNTDPLRLAAYVDPASILFITARFDRTIRPRYGLQLWRALGEPELVALPSGHYSAIIWLPYIRRATIRFFRRRFDWPSE